MGASITEKFDHFADSLNAPLRSVFAVAPHDADALPRVPKVLYVGTGGDVTLRCVDDAQDVTFRNVQAGALIRARAHFVRAMGTTASDILAHC